MHSALTRAEGPEASDGEVCKEFYIVRGNHLILDRRQSIVLHPKQSLRPSADCPLLCQPRGFKFLQLL